MSCNNKIKQTCGSKVYSACVPYEKEIPEFSELSGEGCITVEDTTEDIYKHLKDLKEEIGLSSLGQLCLTYVPNGQVAKVKDILSKYEEEICNLKEKVKDLEETSICDKVISKCDIDLTGISDQCDNPIVTLSDLFNYLIIKVNE